VAVRRPALGLGKQGRRLVKKVGRAA